MTWKEWIAEYKGKEYGLRRGLLATFEYESSMVMDKVYIEILKFSELFGKDADKIYGFCGKSGVSKIDIYVGCFNLPIILMFCTLPESGRLVYWDSQLSRPPRYEEDEMTMFNTISSIWEDEEKKPKQHKQGYSNNSTNKSGGCYIATACYGSYDCTQVLTFRHFRDEYLSQTIAGRMFIRTYYALSPSIAKWLENKHRINTFIRKNFLDTIYDSLKKKY